MNSFKTIKSIPFLTSLIILLILSINNQKAYTRLKIIIWNTPSLSIGTYIAISSGTGFLLSYLVSTNIAFSNKSKHKKINYKSEKSNDENNMYQKPNNESKYDNTLIERDINDPSPTINANFRIIGQTNRQDQVIRNDYEINYGNSYLSEESNDELNLHENDYKYENKNNQINNDWEDNTYLNW